MGSISLASFLHHVALIMRSHPIPRDFSLDCVAYFDRICSQWTWLRVAVWCMHLYCCRWHCHRKCVDHWSVRCTMWSVSYILAHFHSYSKWDFRSFRNHLDFQSRPIDWRTTSRSALSSPSCGWISIFYQMNCHIDTLRFSTLLRKQ